MKRILTALAVCAILALCTSAAAAAEKKPKPGPMTGTWECMSHGSSQGDMPFTLYLEQNKEVVTGSVSSPMGGTEITSASFKDKTLEVHIDTSQGNYVVMGKLKKSELSGTWSVDGGEKGTWEGKKAPPATASK
ncbi:MAG: hypothetical protein ACE145_17525 [Terriglobia bacterium]